MNHTVKWLLWLLYATARARPSMRARDGPSYSMMSSLAAEVHFLKIKHTVPMKKPIYFTFSLWWHSTRDNPVKVKATTAASRVRVPPLHKEEFSKASSSNRKSNKKVQVGFLIGCKISFQSFNFGSQRNHCWAGLGLGSSVVNASFLKLLKVSADQRESFYEDCYLWSKQGKIEAESSSKNLNALKPTASPQKILFDDHPGRLVFHQYCRALHLS